jgi:hypothetical protein
VHRVRDGRDPGGRAARGLPVRRSRRGRAPRPGAARRRDLAADALAWAKERASSTRIEDLPERIGGALAGDVLVVPYMGGEVRISESGIEGADLEIWDRVLLYNHVAQGGSAGPSGEWIGLEELPGSLSKVKSLEGVAERPIAERFDGRAAELEARALALGASRVSHPSADLALVVGPLPRVPVLVLFWSGDPADGFGARVKLLYDRTVEQHLDIESIVFLGERLARALTGP